MILIMYEYQNIPSDVKFKLNLPIGWPGQRVVIVAPEYADDPKIENLAVALGAQPMLAAMGGVKGSGEMHQVFRLADGRLVLAEVR